MIDGLIALLSLQVTIKSLHLSTCDVKLMLFEHFWKFERSCCKAEVSKLGMIVLKILVSTLGLESIPVALLV